MNFLSLLKKYKSILLYIVFGLCTTGINLALYALLYYALGVKNVSATILAWCAAVTFAFFTNKVYVFKSADFSLKVFAVQIALFFLCRLFVGAVETAIMYIAVDKMSLSGIVWKFISNLVATVLNFVLSKLFVFRKRSI